MDLPNAKDNLKAFKNKYPDLKIFEISALNNEGLKELINYLGKKVSELDEVELYNKGEIESIPIESIIDVIEQVKIELDLIK